MDETVVMTGGVVTTNTVSVYTTMGWREDLPSLNTGRYQHACTSYIREKRVGYNGLTLI